MEEKKTKGKEGKEGVPPSEGKEEKKEKVLKEKVRVDDTKVKVLRGIIRIAGRDLKGELPIRRAISNIKGIGANLSRIISDKVVDELHIKEDMPIGNLSEKQIATLEQIMADPAKSGVPHYLLNRQKDPFTGDDKHLVGGDLTFVIKQTIENEKDIYTWRGYRHAFGQKVRGQRTRTAGRKGMTVGVIRKAILEKAGKAAAAGKEKKGKR